MSGNLLCACLTGIILDKGAVIRGRGLGQDCRGKKYTNKQTASRKWYSGLGKADIEGSGKAA